MARTLFPGFQSKPWAGISERFQRIKNNSIAAGKLFLSMLAVVHLQLMNEFGIGLSLATPN